MNWNVFDEHERHWAAGLLHDFMDNADQRVAPPPLPKTAEEWQSARPALKQRMLDMLGIPPAETCGLEPHVLGATERSGYAVERVAFLSRPDCPVTANLYRPLRLDAPTPGVLCPHGHSAFGKGHDVYQRTYISLALKGFVVLAFDAIGFNERRAMGHKHVFAPLLHGGCHAGQIVWDGMKALDYLCSRPEVDQRRIGCTGNSGGGKQTLLLAALDERIAAAAPAGHNATYAYTAAKERDICACNRLPGLLAFAEMDLIYSLIAPRACLMVQGIQDNLFPADLVRRVFRRTRRVYRMLGTEENLGLALEKCGHHYDLPKREAMYAWFNKHLMGNDDPAAAKEPNTRPVPADSPSLVCFPGADGLPPGSATAAELAARDAAPVLAKARERLSTPEGRKAARTELAAILALDKQPDGRPSDVPRVLRREPAGGALAAEKVLLEAEPGVPLPGLLFSGGKGEAMVVVDDAGKGSPAALRAARQFAKQGGAALAVDLRGWGETRAKELSEDGSVDENVAAQRALFAGLPLMGMRMRDVLAARDFLARETGADIGLCGIGLGAVVCALAAAVDGGVNALVLKDIPATFQPNADGQPLMPISFYVHGILRVGDIPDIVSLAAPAAVRVESVVSNSGAKLRGAALREWKERCS